MKEIQSLGLAELRTLLASLNDYKDITKKLGTRGKKLFARNLSGESTYRIEYFPTLSESDVYTSAKQVYSRVFQVSPSQDEIVFIKKESILGGMKVYKDDSMVDMSFSKVEKLLKK